MRLNDPRGAATEAVRWNLPPLVKRTIGAHCEKFDFGDPSLLAMPTAQAKATVT